MPDLAHSVIRVNPSKYRQAFPEEVLDLSAIEIYRKMFLAIDS